MAHVRPMAGIYRTQCASCCLFWHTRLRDASSWRTESTKHLLLRPQVYATTRHRCESRLTTATGSTLSVPALKPTRFTSTSMPVLLKRSKACPGTHPHQHLAARRAAQAAHGPEQLPRAILSDNPYTQDAPQMGAQLSEDDWGATLAMPPPTPTTKKHTRSNFGYKKDGSTVHIHDRPSKFKSLHLDNYTREALPLDTVRALWSRVLSSLTRWCGRWGCNACGWKGSEQGGEEDVGYQPRTRKLRLRRQGPHWWR